jgi:hypothetical protein
LGNAKAIRFYVDTGSVARAGSSEFHLISFPGHMSALLLVRLRSSSPAADPRSSQADLKLRASKQAFASFEFMQLDEYNFSI